MKSFLFKSRNPVRESLGQIAVLASIIVAILYPLNLIPVNPILVKGSAIALLAAYALLRVSSFDHFLLVIALLAGAVGSMQLEISFPDNFVGGLKNVLMGHIFYIIIFWRNRLDAYGISRQRMNGASILWTVVAGAVIYSWPSVIEGKFHLAAYTIGILGMATAAIISRYPLKMVGTGAILFIISDAMIAADIIFVIPDWIEYFVWPLHYIAQLIITAGILLTPVKTQSHSLR